METKLYKRLNNNKLLKSRDVAEQLNVCRATVNSWIKSGQLPCVQLGKTVRVRQEDLDFFILDNLVNG